jgi:CheY-like chemotaxis protein/chromosome segregation ATPase
MPTKVLVFESDPEFAGELRTELDAFGCSTLVVDDGNVGLQQAVADRPDLILLSIELPRMNGFSVCNKLKKDPSLKDVPLIIMSTESSEETFDQHKKLRTRAEAYVHKPIAFAELLEHIQRFVTLTPVQTEAESGIVIEDEIEVGSSDYLLDDEIAVPADGTEAPRPASVRPPPQSLREPSVEAEVDAFAESAFGRLTAHDAAVSNGSAELPMLAPARSSIPPMLAPTRSSIPPVMLSRVSVRPPSHAPIGVDPAEHERVKSELAATRERTDAIEHELAESRREMEKLRIEAGDAARLAREADDLRGKLAAASKTGGISSRDFLDLREALNRKDKEILAIREQLAKKDREIVESQDRTLGLERGRADLEERLLGLERELAEAKDGNDALVSEKDLAKKAGDELRARLDRAKAENEARERQLSELRARQADERAAHEVRLASVRAELDQVLANERAEHARALDHAELRRRSDLDQLRRDCDTAMAELHDQAERERHEALSVQLNELRLDHESKSAAAQRVHALELDRLRAESSQREQSTLESARAEHAQAMRGLNDERNAHIAALEEQIAHDREHAQEVVTHLEGELAGVRDELRQLVERKQAEDAASAATVAELGQALEESRAARASLEEQLASAADRVATLERELHTLRESLSEARERLETEASRADRVRAKWDADRQSLERAKDALAIALSQIEDAENRPHP